MLCVLAVVSFGDLFGLIVYVCLFVCGLHLVLWFSLLFVLYVCYLAVCGVVCGYGVLGVVNCAFRILLCGLLLLCVSFCGWYLLIAFGFVVVTWRYYG